MGFTKYPMQSSGYPLEEAPPIPIRDCIKRNQRTLTDVNVHLTEMFHCKTLLLLSGYPNR